MTMVFGILTLILALANVWFFIQTLIAMNKENTGWAIGGFLFSPFVQIIYFITQKQNLDSNDSSTFKKFFIVTAAFLVSIIIFSALAASSVINDLPVQ